MSSIRLVATDMDGTFARSDNTFDEKRFKNIFSRMTAAGCQFVVASGNQYYQLRDFFPGYDERMSFVAENGAFVKDREEMVFAARAEPEAVRAMLDVCLAESGIELALCGLKSAYVQRGKASQAFFDVMGIYYHHLEWTDDIYHVDDQILKGALFVPDELTYHYYDLLRERLDGYFEATTSGHGSIDLILPGCHKASGLERLARRWNIAPDECIAFGDGGNDVEMLRWCGTGYAMANAPTDVRAQANEVCPSNNDDGVLEVLDQLF